MVIPAVINMLRPKDPDVAAEFARTMDMGPSAVERFGLFTIIVLGEVIVSVVRGVASHHHFDWIAGVSGALGMLIAIGLWWIYFDFVSQRKPISAIWRTIAWIYLPLFVTMGIVATGRLCLPLSDERSGRRPAAADRSEACIATGASAQHSDWGCRNKRRAAG